MRSPIDLSTESPMAGLESHYDEFIQNRLEEIELIKEAITLSDYRLIVNFAHKWKGFSAPFGFGFLGELAKSLEVSAEGFDAKTCLQIIAEVENYLKQKQKI